MKDITSVLTGLKYQDNDDRALALMPLSSDRMTYHTKRLPQVQNATGTTGVAAYRAKFPEAKGVLLKTAHPIAYQPKPKGYDDWLCEVVGTWFFSDTALAESNRATVERLNLAMAPRQFDPDRHFGVVLSAGRLAQLAAVFAEHGAHLDTSQRMSMSAVRSAVKAAKGKRSSGRPFGKVGHITGSQLIIGSKSFTVMQHHGHDCIKIMLNGKRHWFRLDVAAAFIASAGLASGGIPGDDPHYLTIVDIRELVPDAENPVSDPLAGIGETHSSGELVPKDETPAHSSGEVVPDQPLSFRERTAALSARLAARPSHSPASPVDPDADPLALS